MACTICVDLIAEGKVYSILGGKACSGFQPHQWLPTRCVNCRHDKIKHTIIISETPAGAESTSSVRTAPNKITSSKLRAYFSDGDEGRDLSDEDLREEGDEESNDGEFKKPQSKKKGSNRSNSQNFIPPLPRKPSSPSGNSGMVTSGHRVRMSPTSTTPPIPIRERSASVAQSSGDPGTMAKLKEAFGWGTKAKKPRSTLSAREGPSSYPTLKPQLVPPQEPCELD